MVSGEKINLNLNLHADITIDSCRAVVYCDTLQFSAMVLALVAVMFLGTDAAGGVEKVFKIADEGDRLIFFK